MPFNSFGLSDPLVQGILATGYTAPTEIQSQAIPEIIQGHDIIGCAQTGTGKTAAFVLPILNRLSHENAPKHKGVRSLIITPTRELAVQIEKAILTYGRFLKLTTLAVYGGVNIKGQLSALKRRVDIVVATPGRLLDHMQRRTIDLKNIEVLVLDEADKMFDMGFINDVLKIINALPKDRQTLLFSATVTPDIKKLASGVLKSPKMIQIGKPRNPIETITQHIYPVSKEQKMDLLLHMLKTWQMYSVLVFSRTKHGADKICNRLQKAGFIAVAIHSGRNQGQRQRALDGFKDGKFQVMVATDIAARGIDVSGITHVINFDVPAFPEDYLHRIGRTGRAAATGEAITFVSRDEDKYLRKIEEFISRDLNPERCPDFNYSYAEPKQQKPQYSRRPPSVKVKNDDSSPSAKKFRPSFKKRRRPPRR
ncbi:MAG: DEAD/DEAH box helicase [Candidatus Brocadiia bacterium]|nr:MAG: DEAD/DEAH box helicase [Candidatus Brocadiia bacterium]